MTVVITTSSSRVTVSVIISAPDRTVTISVIVEVVVKVVDSLTTLTTTAGSTRVVDVVIMMLLVVVETTTDGRTIVILVVVVVCVEMIEVVVEEIVVTASAMQSTGPNTKLHCSILSTKSTRLSELRNKHEFPAPSGAGPKPLKEAKLAKSAPHARSIASADEMVELPNRAKTNP